MRILTLQLPLELPSPSQAYAYTLTQNSSDAQPVAVASAVASLLPTADRQTEVVALLPAVAVSWHRVELPPGLHKQPARLQSALQGLLEDRLLDDPADLHMALQPGWKNTPRPWVAVCHRAWLKAHLQTLEQAGLSVHRIVPELNPQSALGFGATWQVTALGDEATGWLWFTHPEHGVWGRPLATLRAHGAELNPGVVLTDEESLDRDAQAEPGAVAMLSACLGEQVRLMSPGQHWQSAVAADWDLAQFDLAANPSARRFKNWQRQLSTWAHHPAWRPARWGLGWLLVSQLIGLNTWAWQTRTHLQQQQQSLTQILRDTFPAIPVVVDAPAQMTREVERLRQNSGQLNSGDLESMLHSLGQALPPGLATPTQLNYKAGQVRFEEFVLTSKEQQALKTALAPLGYQWVTEGRAGVMRVKAELETPP